MATRLLFITVIYAFRSLASATKEPRASNCDFPVTLTGNPFATNTLHPNSFYKSKVLAAAATINDTSLKAKALSVANAGSFLWLNNGSLASLEQELDAVPCSAILGVVIHDLPKPFCDSLEAPHFDVSEYKSKYIDSKS
jgi:cellulose 1,4-beta-cellobiosidase